MSKPPVAPYPPDVDNDTPGEIEFGDLVDTVVRDADWAGRKGVGLSARRVELLRCRLTGAELAESALGDVTFEECRVDLVELRGCDLVGLRGGEALRGVRMSWNDVLENAVLFASLAGIEILTDE